MTRWWRRAAPREPLWDALVAEVLELRAYATVYNATTFQALTTRAETAEAELQKMRESR